MNITGMVHVNINCTDYDRSLAFYEMLGFAESWRVPETNTAEVCRAVGMTDYRVRGAILRHERANPPVLIDLLEWREPRDETPPYDNLYRPGIARIALLTSDIDADFAFLIERGVDVLSAPATVAMGNGHGSRFFCFRDPDGTVLELVENF